MRKKIYEWMKNMCREDYEPVWQEPVEWIGIGFVLCIILFNLIL